VVAFGLSSGTNSILKLAARNFECHGTALPTHPVAQDGGDSGDSGDHPCKPRSEAESFQDLYTANTELAARETAPFASAAPGAYLHAIAQRGAVPAAGSATGTGGTWRLAGHAPLCAAQTTGSKVCPAPSAANGKYSYTGKLGFRTLSGRTSSFAYDPSRPGRYFASPVVGGVWETRNGGMTWRSVGNGLPSQTVGALAYDAPRHRIIVGAGDNSFGGSGIAGPGIYYSDNDGRTWRRAHGVPDLILSFKIAVSPVGGGKTVYAATSKGLFRSVNGGTSFRNERVPTSPKGYSPNCAGNTTSHLCFFANDVTDVVVKRTKTANGPAGAVIAAVGWRAGQKVDIGANNKPVPGCKMNKKPTKCLQAPRNGLYTSRTGAPGSFSYIKPGTGGPLALPPTKIFGRTALGIASGPHQSSDAVYALVEDAVKFNGCQDVLDRPSPSCNSDVQGEGVGTVLDGMYASYNFGKSWTKVMDYSQLQQPGTNSAIGNQVGYKPGVQSWYNLWVQPDPTRTDSSGDPSRVLFGLEEVWDNSPQPALGSVTLKTPYTAQAPDSWGVIGRYWNACAVGPEALSVGPCNPDPFTSGPIAGSTTHPDQHAAALIPDAKGGGVTLLVGSDGGAYKQHVAKGQNFNNNRWGNGLNATMSALQPYDAEMAKDGTIVSGLQDNGEMKISPKGAESEIFGGDAFYTAINPTNSKDIIEEYTYAVQVNLSLDGGASWYPIQPSSCGTPTSNLFSTPIEQDPTIAGHLLLGCTKLQEATKVFADPCSTADGGNANNCTSNSIPFKTVYDLSKLHSPNGASNVPSALAVRGAREYVAYCGYCDPATQKLPFANGIATNVGGKKPPKIGTSQGWHQAKALCSGCGTANRRLPERYINSIQEDPRNPNTVYVTLGGYGRRWIPPGSFGESTANVGVGHVFVSHDHGNHFTNITGNLPDISANWTTVHNGKLIVATDLGVYIMTSPGHAARHGHRTTAPRYAALGRGLPAAPVFTVRITPANPNKLLISTYGRSDWTYTFPPASKHHHPKPHH
jgi:hypothetical protein